MAFTSHHPRSLPCFQLPPAGTVRLLCAASPLLPSANAPASSAATSWVPAVVAQGRKQTHLFLDGHGCPRSVPRPWKSSTLGGSAPCDRDQAGSSHTHPIPSHPHFGLTTFVKGVSIAYREVCGRLLSPFIYQLQPLTAISYPQKDEGFAAENAVSSLGRNCKVCYQVLARLKSFSVQQSTKKEKGAMKPAGFRAIVKSRLEMEEPLTDFSYI